MVSTSTFQKIQSVSLTAVPDLAQIHHSLQISLDVVCLGTYIPAGNPVQWVLGDLCHTTRPKVC